MLYDTTRFFKHATKNNKMHQYSLYYFDKTTYFVIISEKKLKSCTFDQFPKHFKLTATNIAIKLQLSAHTQKGVAKHRKQHQIAFVPIIGGNMVMQKTSFFNKFSYVFHLARQTRRGSQSSRYIPQCLLYKSQNLDFYVN